MKLIIDAFEIIFPVLVFMDFIENDQRRRCIISNHMRKESLVPEKLFSMIGDIPIPIKAVGKGSRNHFRQRRFARLAGASQENH